MLAVRISFLFWDHFVNITVTIADLRDTRFYGRQGIPFLCLLFISAGSSNDDDDNYLNQSHMKVKY